VPVRGHPRGHHDRLRDHPVINPGFAVRGVREPLGGQATVAERGRLSVQVRADPADLGLGDPAVRAQLALPNEDASTVPSAIRLHAVGAAGQRWANHRAKWGGGDGAS
jgi:hypothetical protein